MRAKYTPRTNPAGFVLRVFRLAGRKKKREESAMKNVCYIRQETLGDLAGRIDYISNEERQEHIYATYSTAPDGFWRGLAKENQAEFLKNGTRGSCIEARELIIALPKEMRQYDPDELLRFFVERYKNKYDVECTAALHHNKAMSNYHIHLIYSERRKLDEPEVKIATRDRYYDPGGKHVRTKKEATDEKGNLLKGFTKIAKGEVYETKMFGPKDKRFKSKEFVDEAKHFFVDLMNLNVSEQSRMHVFPSGGPYLPTKKIGKNNPRAEDIKEDNRLRDEWNREVQRARAMNVPKESMMIVKQRLIEDPIYKSKKEHGGKFDQGAFRNIIAGATKVLSTMIRESRYFSREEWYKAWIDLIDDFVTFCCEKVFGVDLSRKNVYQRQKAKSYDRDVR